MTSITCTDCGEEVDAEAKIGPKENVELVLVCDKCDLKGRVTDKEYLDVFN